MNEQNYREVEQALFRDAGLKAEERWIQLPTPGVRARALEAGNGPAVVFLHGGPSTAAVWAYVVAALPDVRAILLDRPGCGLSEPPTSVPDSDTLPGYVTQLTRDVFDALELERAVLVGSSFGGYSALRSALAMPERVRALVIAGCPAFAPGWAPPKFFSLLRTPVLGRLILAMPATRGSAKMFLKQMGEGAALKSGTIGKPVVEWVHAWQKHTDTMRNDARMILAAGKWRQGFDPSLEVTAAELAGVACPTVIVSGSDDPLGGDELIASLAGMIPGARATMVPGIGHLPMLGAPAPIAAAIRDVVAVAEAQAV